MVRRCHNPLARSTPWLALALALVAAPALFVPSQPVLAQSAPDSSETVPAATDLPDAAEALALPEDDFAALEQLVDLAPNRQLGQPGNERLSRLIEQRFQQLVAEQNPEARHTVAQEALAQAEQARAEVTAAAENMQRLGTGDEEAQVSFWVVRYTLEDPTVASILLLLLAGVFALVAWSQGRRSVYMTSAVVAAVAVVLPILAGVIDTPTEQAQRTAAGEEDAAAQTWAALREERDEAMREAMRADRRTAEAMDGLWQNGQVRYPMTVFEPGEAHLSLPTGEGQSTQLRIHQLQPNLVDPSNLPEEGFTGPLVYLNQGRARDLPGKALQGAVVLLEFDSGGNWVNAVELGAEAVIFLSPREAWRGGFAEAEQKMSFAPVNVPRFYIERDKLAGALGEQWLDRVDAGMDDEVSIQQEPGRWVDQDVATNWLFIPGTGEGLDEDETRNSLVHLQTYLDSNSIVPNLSPGAQSGSNLVLMLRMLERYRQQPPARNVLISVVNGHAAGLRGETMFAFSAFADPSQIRRELEEIDRELAQQRFVSHLYANGPSASLIRELRTRIERIGGRMFSAKDPIVEVMNLKSNAAARRASQLAVRIEQARHALSNPAMEVTWTEQEIAEQEQRLSELQAESDRYVPLLQQFSRFGQRTTIEELEGTKLWDLLTEMFEQTAAEAHHRVEALAHRRERMIQNLSLRRRLLALNPSAMEEPIEGVGYETLFDRRYTPLPSTAVFCLDLAFGTDRAGFFSTGYWTPTSTYASVPETARARVGRLARHTLNVADAYEAEADGPAPLVSTMLNDGGQPWQAHLSRRLILGSRAVHDYAQSGLTLTSVQDDRQFAFSPQDTPGAIDRENFDKLMGFSKGYLPRLIDAPGLEATRQDVGDSRTLLIQLTLHTLDDFSVEMATAKTAGALVLTWPEMFERSEPPILSMFGEVAPYTLHTSNASGQVMLRSRRWQDSSVLAFDFADDSYRKMNAALDFGDGERKYSSVLSVRNTGFHTRSLVMFQADKVDLFGVTQALTLLPADTIEIIKAKQNTSPRHFSVVGVGGSGGKPIPRTGDGTAAMFIEPGQRFKLTIQGAPALNASPEEPEGVGFRSDIGRLRNLSIQPARDMHELNSARLNSLADKGVTDEVAGHYNSKSGELLDALDEARQVDRLDLVQTLGEEARGVGYRSYTMTVGTINDLIKAVVVVLGLIIPASFFIMKLVTPFTNINTQIGMFGLFFALLTLLLLMVHPAFQIADTPTVVILAFVILGLAVFVSSVIAGRFNTTMTQAIEESQMSEGVDAPRGRLAGVAFMVGVNNMKRRRIRTTLTAATVVLVTFTSLSVMSVGRSSQPVRLRVGDSPAYNGFVFTRPNMGPLTATQMQNLRAHFEHRAEVSHRVWVQQRSDVGSYLPSQIWPMEPREGAVAEALNAKIVLGLQKKEDGFIAPMPLAGGRWFSDDEAREIVLSVEAGALLGFTPEDLAGEGPKPVVRMKGRDLTLVGLVDDERLAEMHDLGDTPLLPLTYPASQNLAAQSINTQEAEGTASMDPAASPMESTPGVEPARPIDVAIVPAELAGSLEGASYRVLSVKYTDQTTTEGAAQSLAVETGQAEADDAADQAPAPAQRAWNDATRLVDFQHVRLPGVGLSKTVEASDGSRIEAGQYAIASRSTTQVGGILKVAIPIALGATIIFNTMLGAVMERRREISIYNAIGLNPTHVMLFFLAESLVFGLVGAVAGYLIGQVLSVLITQFNLFDLNLNYSSLSVMLVIFITIATVLLSTIYPAAMAARAAVPSGQRKWSLPQPEGDEIRLTFPFLYNDRHVLGVCAYLRDFMQQNSEASTGKFLAQPGTIGLVPGNPQSSDGDDDHHDRALAMLFDVAPAPFDLGVNQRMEVYAFFDNRVGAYMLGVHLTRLSGQRNNWVTVNQPFLEAMRKRLLGWRSQKPEVQQTFCDQGQALFADAPDLPTIPPEAPQPAPATAQAASG